MDPELLKFLSSYFTKDNILDLLKLKINELEERLERLESDRFKANQLKNLLCHFRDNLLAPSVSATAMPGSTEVRCIPSEPIGGKSELIVAPEKPSPTEECLENYIIFALRQQRPLGFPAIIKHIMTKAIADGFQLEEDEANARISNILKKSGNYRLTGHGWNFSKSASKLAN